MSEAPAEPGRNPLVERADIWTRYWATGATHSCAGTFGAHYEGAIGKWWQLVFEGLGADARVLDLATGSGAVLQLALKHCGSPAVRLHGVDASQSSPAWTLTLTPEQHARLQIHPGVLTENLPFGDQSFEWVTTQFGIEYTDLHRSLLEVRRVLCAGGSLRGVLHHADSQSVQLAHAEVAHIQWLLEPSGLLDIAEQLCEPFSRAVTPQGRAELVNSHSANALRQRFNLLQDERLRKAKTSSCPDVLHEASDAVNQVFRAAAELGVSTAQAQARGYTQKLRDAEFRLSELIEHALSQRALQDMLQQLNALGFAATAGVLTDSSRLMGWWLKADLPR